MEHETTPNRQISRSRFVSPFCVCFDDKNVFDPPSAGTPNELTRPATGRARRPGVRGRATPTPKLSSGAHVTRTNTVCANLVVCGRGGVLSMVARHDRIT